MFLCHQEHSEEKKAQRETQEALVTTAGASPDGADAEPVTRASYRRKGWSKKKRDQNVGDKLFLLPGKHAHV